MAKKSLDKTSAAARALEEIRRRREEQAAVVRRRKAEDLARWNAQAQRMAARGRAADQEHFGNPKSSPAQLAPEKAPSCAPAGKAGAVLEARHSREGGRGITYERKTVLCGKKGCNKLHGPYWYAFWTAGGRVRSVYIGKKFQKVEEKCPERLKTAV
jgi:hypothetical protein